MRARWRGDDLWRLLNWSVAELQKYYPDYKKGTLKGKKVYWRNKLNNGEIDMPPEPKSDLIKQVEKDYGLTVPKDAVVNYHIGYIKNSEGEIEYTKPLPSVHTGHLAKPNVEFEPAQPAQIKPSQRKSKNRNHKILYVFSDSQIDYRRLDDNSLLPIHDETALEIGAMICRDLQPDEIINLGDTVDLAELSSFKPDSDHFYRTIAPSLQRVHDYYAQLRADTPKAKITEVDSNHNARLKKFVLKYSPQLYGMKRAGEDDYPVMTYPYLVNLKPLDVNWIGGYGAAEYVYGEDYDSPPIVFKHGTTVVSTGSTAAKESRENPETHIVRGHGHRLERHTRTTRAGKVLTSIQIGATCKTTGEVPSYGSGVDDNNQVVRKQENWQTTVLVIYDYGGYYQFDNIIIEHGRAYYQGKLYEIVSL